MLGEVRQIIRGGWSRPNITVSFPPVYILLLVYGAVNNNLANKLTKYEQETIYNFNRGDDMAYIFTYDKGLQKHLEEKLGLKPIMVNSKGGKDYLVDKKMISKPQRKRRVLEKDKNKLVERFNRKPFCGEK